MSDFDNAFYERTLAAAGGSTETTELDLDNVLEETLERAWSNRGKRRIDFAAVRAATLPRALRGNPARLSEALLDLAENVSKRTGEGCVLLRADLIREERDTVIVRFSAAADGEIEPARGVGRNGALAFTLRMQKQSVQPAVQPHALHGGRAIIAADSAAMRFVLREHLSGCGMQAVATSLDDLHARIDDGHEDGRPFHLAVIDCEVVDDSCLSKLISLLDDRRLARVPVVLVVPERQLAPSDEMLPAVTHKLRKPVHRSAVERLLAHAGCGPETRAHVHYCPG